jgi:hypothetical protein
LPRKINPALSMAVEAVLLKALEKKAGDRYQSGRDLMGALRAALTIKPVIAPEGAPPLPPIPVGAPPVQRSEVSLNSFTKRKDVLTALERRSTISRSDIEEGPTSRRLSIGQIFLYVLLVAVLAMAFKFYPALLSLIEQPTNTATLPIITIAADPINTQNPATDTSVPVPPTFTATSSPSATPSQTSTQALTPTLTATATLAVTATQTVRYPAGHLMTAFYNLSSFYLLDRGKASRSVSGFSFARVNQDGSLQNFFDGWEWQRLFKVIQPTRCLSLELEPPPAAYLLPAECKNRIISYVRFAPTSSTVFWTPNENSLEFKVMWLDEEIARCTIEAGTCDFYVP